MIRPLHDYILVEPIVRTLSKTLWTDNRENYCQGYIRAVGKKADQSLLNEFIIYGGEEYLNWKVIWDEGKKYQIIQEADICCVVDNYDKSQGIQKITSEKREAEDETV